MGETPVTYVTAPPRDIARIVQLIEAATEGEEPSYISIACMAVAICLEHPQISPEQLSQGITGCSEWIALFLTDTDIKKAN